MDSPIAVGSVWRFSGIPDLLVKVTEADGSFITCTPLDADREAGWFTIWSSDRGMESDPLGKYWGTLPLDYFWFHFYLDTDHQQE